MDKVCVAMNNKADDRLFSLDLPIVESTLKVVFSDPIDRYTIHPTVYNEEGGVGYTISNRNADGFTLSVDVVPCRFECLIFKK